MFNEASYLDVVWALLGGVGMPNNLQIASQYLARWHSGDLLHLQLAFLRSLRMVCVGRYSSPIFLQPAGTSSTRLGCTHLQLAWPWVVPRMGHPPALWVLSTLYSLLFAFFSNLKTSGNIVLNKFVCAQNTLWQKAPFRFQCYLRPSESVGSAGFWWKQLLFVLCILRCSKNILL